MKTSSRTQLLQKEYNFMDKIVSLHGKITPEFIDYCNLNNINLVSWYKWQLHLIWEQRNIYRKLKN